MKKQVLRVWFQGLIYVGFARYTLGAQGRGQLQFCVQGGLLEITSGDQMRGSVIMLKRRQPTSAKCTSTTIISQNICMKYESQQKPNIMRKAKTLPGTNMEVE